MRDPTFRLPFFLFLCCVSFQLHPSAALSAAAEAGEAPSPFEVGVVLDMNSTVGRASLTSFRMAFADFSSTRPASPLRFLLLPQDSAEDVVTATSAALDLLTNNHVNVLLGPQTSPEAAFVADLATAARVPAVSSSATSPALSPSHSPFFIRAVPSDAMQAPAIAAVVAAFGWRRLVPIYEDSDYGAPLVPILTDALADAGVTIPYRLPLPSAASNDRITTELYKLMTEQTRVFLVHVTASLAGRLFTCARLAGMMTDGYAWIITEGLTSLLPSLEPGLVLDSMQGVIGIKPFVPRSNRVHEFKRRWRREFLTENPTADPDEVTQFAIWAYNAAWAVASAADSLGPARPEFAGPAGFPGLRVSKTGGELRDLILETEFEGVGGRFKLVNGELNITAYRIVNVIGERGREIGFWTARFGLTRTLNRSSEGSYSVAREGLGAVIWPGDVTVAPKGWVVSTSGRRLRVAVPGPVEPGFQAFLSVERNPATNETTAEGFAVEVFEAAVQRLPYALPFEYVLWEAAGDYNDLVRQVALGRFDAVVGDVTITANRSLYADFTMPYTVSGVSMVVPVKDTQSKNAWIFLKPLTADLWLVSGVFFVFTGMVVWVLEHRVNEEFRGPPAHQLGTVFYFAFSTLVYAHRENVVSNLSRFVVIIWVFVVLILSSSYTASLTSMLTVRQFEPAVTDLNELIKNGGHVGYLKDSFVKGLLLKFGFDESKLRPYKSPQQYADALAKGNENGGVAAIVDEIPYLKVFLKDYCQNYTMAGQTYKTGGFGFAFPKASPIVPDLSRAILNLTESDEMVEIEKRWLGDESACLNQGSTLASDSLDFKSFWGLFLITGTASVLSCLIYLFSFLRQNWRDLKDAAGRTRSPISTIHSFAKVFDKKDLSSHTFKKERELQYATTMNHRDPSASPYPNYYHESPMSQEGTAPSLEAETVSPCTMTPQRAEATEESG